MSHTSLVLYHDLIDMATMACVFSCCALWHCGTGTHCVRTMPDRSASEFYEDPSGKLQLRRKCRKIRLASSDRSQAISSEALLSSS